MVTMDLCASSRRQKRTTCLLVAALAVLVLSSEPSEAEPIAADSAVFNLIAKELLEGLNETLGTGGEGRPSGSKIAVRPFSEDEIPVSSASAKRFTELLSSALFRQGGKRFSVVARSQLSDVIDEITAMGELENWNTNPVAALLTRAKVEILVTGWIRRRERSALISFRAIRVADGRILAASGLHRVALASVDTSPAGAALSLTQAVRRAARHFREYASDMTELALAGFRFEDTGVQTRFGRYLQNQIADATSASFLDVLKDRKLVVRRAELDPERLRSMRDTPVDGRILRAENFDARPGRYTLTGNYWDFGKAVELRLELRDAAGGIVAWRNRFRAETVPPGFAVRPAGHFDKFRENDGLGPITFDLSSARGKDPEYRFGEKLNLMIRIGQDAWLYCFYLDADGRLFKIFPNYTHKEALIKGRRLHTLPGKLYPFEFDIAKPAGLELVKCFAMSRNVAADLPPDLRKLEFEPLPKGTELRLAEKFRRIPDVSLTEASLVVTVTN